MAGCFIGLLRTPLPPASLISFFDPVFPVVSGSLPDLTTVRCVATLAATDVRAEVPA